MNPTHRFLFASSVVVAIAACGAEREEAPPGRVALGGAPNPAFMSGPEAEDAKPGLPELGPGESFILVEGLPSDARALRPTRNVFDGACTNLYGTGDFGEDFPDGAPAGEDDVVADDADEPPADDAPADDDPSLLPEDDLEVHLHLMPPLGEQPAEGVVIEHVLSEDQNGTYVSLSDFTSATTLRLARATITVGAEVGGRQVLVEGRTEDGVRVVAGYRLAAGETQ